jgi:hypothetical protein
MSIIGTILRLFLGKRKFVKTIVLVVEIFKISEIRIFTQE